MTRGENIKRELKESMDKKLESIIMNQESLIYEAIDAEEKRVLEEVKQWLIGKEKPEFDVELGPAIIAEEVRIKLENDGFVIKMVDGVNHVYLKD